MPRAYPAEFRARAIALGRAGKEQKQTAVDLGIHPVTLSKWLRQDDIDNGRRPGRVSEESAELRAARRQIPHAAFHFPAGRVEGSSAAAADHYVRLDTGDYLVHHLAVASW
ncbi:Transposase [Streptomyces wuyuanensis]|uniref:Transposase n=1 Tax=Streptomyces wuyuanensis TaxID=1196353 RepID=A0A1G9ZZ58_9ACTN|nr:Transposase [Streptomyces wuyuanensis]